MCTLFGSSLSATLLYGVIFPVKNTNYSETIVLKPMKINLIMKDIYMINYTPREIRKKEKKTKKIDSLFFVMEVYISGSKSRNIFKPAT